MNPKVKSFFRKSHTAALILFVIAHIILTIVLFKELKVRGAEYFIFLLPIGAALINIPVAGRITGAIFKEGKLGNFLRRSVLFIVGVLRTAANVTLILFIIAMSESLIKDARSKFPVKEKEYLFLEDAIKRGDYSGAQEKMRKRHDSTYNYNRLSAAQFRATVKQVTRPDFKRVSINDSLRFGLSRFRTDEVFYSDSLHSRYDSVWGSYIPREEMAELTTALLASSYLSPRFREVTKRILTTVDADNLEFDKLKADSYAKRHEVEKALKYYKIYIDKCKKENTPVPPTIRAYVDERKSGAAFREKLYSEVMRQLPPLFFRDYDSDESLSIFDKRDVNEFRAYIYDVLYGYDGIFYWVDESEKTYKGFYPIVNSLFGTRSSDVRNRDAMEMISGVTILKKSSSSDLDFDHYNGEFFTWCRKNMIPSPNETIAGVSYQRLYNILFRERVQEMYLAHLYLYYGSMNGIESIAAEYKRALKKNKHSGWEFFYDYSTSFPEEVTDNGFANTNVEYGTWVRRHIDGSYNELLELVKAILTQYDQTWKERADRYCPAFWEPEDYYEGDYDGY